MCGLPGVVDETVLLGTADSTVEITVWLLRDLRDGAQARAPGRQRRMRLRLPGDELLMPVILSGR
jgi:hypothetical protein